MILKRISSILYSPKYLFPTNISTGVLFFATGDFIVQKVIEQHADFKWKRFGDSCTAGAYMGFFCHFWYGFLDKIFPGRTRLMILKKLASEAVIGPPFAASMFFLVGKLNQKSSEQIWSEIKDNFKYLIMVDWGFYIPLQYFNFNYLPPKFRVLYVSMLSLIYDSVLIYILFGNEIDRIKNKSEKMIESNEL